MSKQDNVINPWSESAPYWEKYREIIRKMFAPITESLLEDARIENRHNVLDVATGPGEPALSIVERVGPEGRVVGIDPAPEMISAARREAARRGLKNTQFHIAPADDLPFDAEMFDAVVSRFGVMFFPSPVDSIREILRVLKPGRRLAMAVWHFAERNPFHFVLSQVVQQYVASTPVDPDSPDAFRFAAPGKLKNILDEAGATASFERLLEFRIEAPVSVEEFWTVRSQMSDKLRSKLATLSNEQLAAVRQQVIEELRRYSTDRGMSFPAEVLIVGGTRHDKPAK